MRVWLFDIDGTLIASGGAGQAATFAALGHAFNVPVNPAGVGFAGRTDRAIATEVFRSHGIPNTQENWKTFQQVYLDQLRHHLHERSGEVLCGARELLEHLVVDKQNHLGLLTGNIQAGAEQKMRHYGLWHHFGFGGFGDHHESRNDVAREALNAASSHLDRQVAPSDVWVVGDTVNDIRCAREIGANVIAVSTGGASAKELEAAQPDLLLEDLAMTTRLMTLLA